MHGCQKPVQEGKQACSSGEEALLREEDEDEDAEDVEVKESHVGKAGQTSAQVFPWEAPETFYLTLMKGFGAPAWLLDLTPGSGFAGLAACRLRVRYDAMALTESHRQYVMEFIHLAILMEAILNTSSDPDSFTFRKRVLSRAQSLTGEPEIKKAREAVDPQKPETSEKVVKPETSEKVAKSTASGSGSSGSDDDDDEA